MYFSFLYLLVYLSQGNGADRNLFKIAELKDHFEDDDIQHNDHAFATKQPEIEGPLLLFGSNKYVTKHEIVASFPSRPIVDRLVSTYFSVMDMAPGKSFFSFGKEKNAMQLSADTCFSSYS